MKFNIFCLRLTFLSSLPESSQVGSSSIGQDTPSAVTDFSENLYSETVTYAAMEHVEANSNEG